MAVDPERHARTLASLSDSPFDLVVASSPTEVLLLTGYWPVMGDSIAFFTSRGEVRVVLPDDEVELAEEMSSAKLIPYKPDGVHTLADPLHLLKEPLRCVIDGLALPHTKIGLQLGQGVQPSSHAVYAQFRSRLVGLLHELAPASTYLGCDERLEDMKAVKTTKELELMQTAANVAEVGFVEAAHRIRPGLRETDVAAAAQSAFETTRKAEGLQRSYGYFFCMSGPNSATADTAYARTRQRLIEDGDLVMIHANTCADGYWTDLTRTYIAGEPRDRQCDIRAAIDEARTIGLRVIRPGATGQQVVDDAVRATMELHGFGNVFKHAAGHGVGFAAANPNGRPRIHPLSTDVLEAGMTFNLEPAAYFTGYGGMRHCDVVTVTNDGVKVMTEF
jgi:Xaa-Pro aminopeptidase